MIGRRSCIILSGPIGSGKTRSLKKLVGDLAASGHRVAAVAQPDIGRRPDGGALGFELELMEGALGALRSERLPLARELSPGELPSTGTLTLGRFAFEPESFALAAGFFGRVLAGPALPEALGLDEIGRLELGLGKGLREALDLCLAAAAGEGGRAGPRLLICASRDAFAVELGLLAESRGLAVELIGREGLTAGLAIALEALRRG
jgi:nucleoside-triphosphatase THEP1